MRRPIVMGNWKMNGVLAESLARAEALRCAEGLSGADVVVFPPFVHLAPVVEALRGSVVEVGGQDVSAQAMGAYTGDVAAPMLHDVGCRWVLAGHSERRQQHGESSELVAAKVAAALASGLRPVLCVGESLQERQAGRTEEVLSAQLAAVLSRLGAAALQPLVLAYEPVWAIGSGLSATPEQAQHVHAHLRSLVAQESVTIASELRIVYGGSVNQANIASLMAMPDVDGALVGGASLQAEGFVGMVQAASRVLG